MAAALRNGLDFRSKRFNDHRTIVLDIFERLGNFVPGDIAATGRPPVVFAGVNVFQTRTHRANRVAQRFLLDVHVEGVEHNLTRRMIDAVNHF